VGTLGKEEMEDKIRREEEAAALEEDDDEWYATYQLSNYVSCYVRS
jgi:hypothetical protein